MKLGLCFGGGGARGAYQIGACQALYEAGILDKVEIYSGTSIGAANAAMVASTSLDVCRKIWFQIPQETLRRTENLFSKLIHEPGSVVLDGVFEIDELEKILYEKLDFENLKKRQVYVTLSDAGTEDGGLIPLIKSTYRHYVRHDSKVIYTDICQHDREHAFQEIIASCSIPIVFSPTNIDGKQYFDGGLYDNVPVRPLIESGCDTIIVLQLDHLPYFYKHRYKDVTFHTIKPSGSLGFMLKFAADQSIIRYNLGYHDCKRYLETNKII